MTNPRLSADERREAILDASMPLFAQLGYNGVTTKQIADAAGVSEALLYRHFKTKRDLYESIQDACVRDIEEHASMLSKLEASTNTLVLSVYFLISRIVSGPNRDDPEHHRCIKRLMLSSILQEGNFARGFIDKNVARWLPFFEEMMQAAQNSGDLVGPVVPARVRFWLTHHLAAGVTMYLLPQKRVVAYGCSQEELVDHVTHFALRGIGLTPEAIAQHFKPNALRMLMEG